MRFRKVYGQSKVSSCYFCGQSALRENKQGVLVCSVHVDKQVGEMRCACGRWLDLRQGKYGPFFTCMSCGVVNLKKAKEVNPPSAPPVRERKEITIRSDEVDLY